MRRGTRNHLELFHSQPPQHAVYTGGNQVQLLRGGDALFPALLHALDQAKQTVWLATYIFHNDATALNIAQRLCNAAQRGVQVKVVLDGFGSRATALELQQFFENAGVTMTIFRPIHRWWNCFQPGQFRRLHQKLCVIDAEIAFVGGINFMNDRLDLVHGWSEKPRLDFAVQLRGPIVLEVAQAVRAVWTRAHWGKNFQEELMTLARTSEPISQVKHLLKQLHWPHIQNVQGGTQESFEGLPTARVALILRDNLRRRRTIERSYIAAIRHAQTRIDLACSYFYPGRAFLRALRQAAQRGVQVRLLLQGKVDYRIAGWAARALYQELLGAGIRVFEYSPAFLHAKVALVDNEWATVGSSNIDPLSLLLNLEANVIVRDPYFNAQLAAELEQAFAVSHEIEPEQTQERKVKSALRRGWVAWCAYVYLRIAGAADKY